MALCDLHHRSSRRGVDDDLMLPPVEPLHIADRVIINVSGLRFETKSSKNQRLCVRVRRHNHNSISLR